jgi:hypothetical protein
MSTWQSVSIKLQQSNDCNFETLIFKYDIRLHLKRNTVRNYDIRTNVWKCCLFNILFKRINIPIKFMISDSRNVKFDLIHQCGHRVIDRIILIVYRISGSVVAS